MYVHPNFPSKAALKKALKEGQMVTVFQPNDVFGQNAKLQQASGVVTVEGPHYPKPHRWYAEVEHDGGRVVRVVS